MSVIGYKSNFLISYWSVIYNLPSSSSLFFRPTLTVRLQATCLQYYNEEVILYTVFRKNTHSHFLSYLHEWCVDFNKNCSECTQGKVDSGNIEIRYSLRPMT